MSNSFLNIDNISYSYSGSSWRLDSISLDISKGDFIGIAGANGSGKSTLLKIAAGILKPDNGRILLEDQSITKIPRRELARKIGYLPQQVNSAFEFTVKEVVLMGRFCHSKGLGLTTAEDRKIADHCMNATETLTFRDRSINELSSGERQRVLLASVLAQQPDIMLLDEPVTGLDLHHQISFFNLLAEFSKKGMTIITITHDLNLASQFCDKILLLDKGKKEIYDSVEKAFERLGQMNAYSDNISIFRHPHNQKPALLPYYNFSEESA
ncbi:putative siderophore transport system ATP-binding protein YusV [Sedimentisphaera cyanobacteriorum]|uniref:Putative siderophore transport system ATP-binding protein YusV n=1 Tax=Sedimentisphaera cyanobacteriorum TaxID=1940790 RepID=A0A1Q2HQY8_9BACT|nr:ABC transporter ATP-binding protein [Sedimentisphaera cyanobacteriorum]AQQ09879.1 putative siderophore transport system ATP-binding protein YusV [Sedimentisphaera cyanobacteriorum]